MKFNKCFKYGKYRLLTWKHGDYEIFMEIPDSRDLLIEQGSISYPSELILEILSYGDLLWCRDEFEASAAGEQLEITMRG